MPNYRRALVTGASWFFTVNLLRRGMASVACRLTLRYVATSITPPPCGVFRFWRLGGVGIAIGG
jgi:hypothetical protein